MKPKVVVDEIQASTVFEDDLAPGEFHEMKPEAIAMAEAVPAPEYVHTASIKRNVSKHEVELRATLARQQSIEKAMKLIMAEPNMTESSTLKHNQHRLGASVATIKPSNPNAIKRRF